MWRRLIAKSPKLLLNERIISSALKLPVEKRFLEILLFGILLGTLWTGNQPLTRNALTDDSKTWKRGGAAYFNGRSAKKVILVFLRSSSVWAVRTVTRFSVH